MATRIDSVMIILSSKSIRLLDVHMSVTALKKCQIIVKKSPIHGYGVFAAEQINAGSIIEECYALPITTLQKELNNYYFTDGKKNILALGYGSIYNHAHENNAAFGYHAENALLIFTASRTIQLGEEIFIDYGKEWFKSRRLLPTQILVKNRQKNKMLLRFLAVLCLFFIVVKAMHYYT